MITRFNRYNESYKDNHQIGDIVYVCANDHVESDKGEIGIYGDAAEILDIDRNYEGYIATVKLLSQEDKIVTLYDYELIKKITKEQSEKMKYNFNIDDIVMFEAYYKPSSEKFSIIKNRRFNGELKEQYFISDATNPQKYSFQGIWVDVDDIRYLTKNEKDTYEAIKAAKTYNL